MGWGWRHRGLLLVKRGLLRSNAVVLVPAFGKGVAGVVNSTRRQSADGQMREVTSCQFLAARREGREFVNVPLKEPGTVYLPVLNMAKSGKDGIIGRNGTNDH